MLGHPDTQRLSVSVYIQNTIAFFTRAGCLGIFLSANATSAYFSTAQNQHKWPDMHRPRPALGLN